MVGLETVTALMVKHGLAFVAPLAVLEGPIVTVIAAWLASQGAFPIWAVALVVIVADLVGDVGLYALGRWGLGLIPARLRRRLHLEPEHLATLEGHFDEKGGRTLLFGKFTHSMGFAVLVAAGAGRMSLGRFAFFNFLGTVPKSLFFVGLGYLFGAAYTQVDHWIARVSLIFFVLIVAGGVSWLLYRRAKV